MIFFFLFKEKKSGVGVNQPKVQALVGKGKPSTLQKNSGKRIHKRVNFSFVHVMSPRLWEARVLDWLYLFNIPLKLLMTYRKRVKQLLHTDSRPSGAWVVGFLDDLPIVIKHQSSPDLRGYVAGRNSHIAVRESRCHGVRNSQGCESHAHFSDFRPLKPLLKKCWSLWVHPRSFHEWGVTVASKALHLADSETQSSVNALFWSKLWYLFFD